LLRAIAANRWVDISDVLSAQIALIAAQRKQWGRPVGELVDPQPLRADITPLTAREVSTALRMADGVDRAARYGIFRPQCLARAIALSSLLDANGITAHRIRVGVRKNGADFGAHVWVELGDLTLGDDTVDVETYVPLTDIAFTSRPRRQSAAAMPATESVR
jgi:hypothetical protein